ncbi:response regulator transcription factor [Streptomyces pactum]|uniref:Response regulator transcription factor n=1 Tax=Streptomyces pactum TaxID=68249 RepID=A0ABS0NFT0_9ACTN|nr:LuxR C-terminal-related transcriptional regulator [Streptomyces pactum]MBH5334023.1 response regulator transcription factor [Streptomyces pactum]
MSRIDVTVHGADPLLRAGLKTVLTQIPELRHVEENSPRAGTAVPVVAVGLITAESRAVVASSAQGRACVLVASEVTAAHLPALAGSGVRGVVDRQEAEHGALLRAVRAVATGGGTLPDSLTAQLLSLPQTQMTMTEREIRVLRLIAEGCETVDIASALAYSVRTVKTIVYDVSVRLGARNRSHLVAMGFRAGYLT